MIHAYVKKLRHAADVLEDLLSSNPFDQPKVARAIAADVDQRHHGGVKKGHRYDGTHWKQREKIAKIAAEFPRPPAAALASSARTPGGVLGKKFKPGTHWTQKPENRAKNLRILRTASRRRQQARAAAASSKE